MINELHMPEEALDFLFHLEGHLGMALMLDKLASIAFELTMYPKSCTDGTLLWV